MPIAPFALETGQLQQWNDERGFGYIAPQDGSARLFVHISAFTPRPAPHQRPFAGQSLQFTRERHEGRWRAAQVRWQAADPAINTAVRSAGPFKTPVGVKAANNTQQPRSDRRQSKRSTGSSGAAWRYGCVALGAMLIAGLYLRGRVGLYVPLLYLLLSIITFGVYWKDKAAAQAGRWRTPENTLHSLALLGGWPGALLAQQWLRHKSSKPSFLLLCAVTVLLNMAYLLISKTALGSSLLSRFCQSSETGLCGTARMLIQIF